MFKSPGNPGNNEKTLNYWKFWKFYMLKILKHWFNTFEKSIQKWKFSLFLTIPTNFKDPNENIFNFPTYSRPSRTRWCLFHKNQSQKNFEKNHWISPSIAHLLNKYAIYSIHRCIPYTICFGTKLAKPQNPCLERAYFLESET